MYIFIFCIFFSCNTSEKDVQSRINTKPKDSTIIYINDSPVHYNEYMLFLNAERAVTFNYFYRKHKAEISPEFWKTQYDGEEPSNYIKDQTNKQLLHVKVVQGLAAKVKLVPEFLYKEFLEYWKINNEERKTKYDNDEVVYGSVELGIKDYYSYLFSNLEIRLKNKLDKEKFTPTDKELQHFYNKIEKDHFLYAEELKVQYLQSDYIGSDSQNKQLTFEEVRKEIKMGRSMSQIAEHSNWTFKKQTYFDSIPSHGEENPHVFIRNAALNLNLNEIMLVEADQQYFIIGIDESPEKKIKTFNEVKDIVLSMYQQLEYDKLINSLKASAVIKKNTLLYENLEIK